MKKLFWVCLFVLAASSVSAQAPFKVNGLTSTGPIIAPNIVNKVINVTAAGYGAKCDGSSDDYPAFAAAMVTAGASPGSTVYIPPSLTVCLLSAALSVPTQTTIWAYPNSVTVAPKVGNVGAVLLFGLQNFAVGVTIYGVTLDGGGVDFANAAPLVQAYRVERFVMDRVTIQNTRGLGLNLSSSNRSGVQNSTVINAGNHWISTTSAADRMQGISFCCNDAGTGFDNFATNNYFEKIGLDAINVGLQSRFVASNNRFNLTSNQTSVVTAAAYPAAIYCSSSDATITGNSIFGAIGNGIDTYTCSTNISGNRVTTSGAAAILLSAATSAVVSGNTLLDNNQVSSGADANFPGGIAFCGLNTNISIVGNRSGNLAGVTQKNGIYGNSATVGTCVTPTFTNLVISPSNDLSTNATASIGGGATGLLALLVAYTPVSFAGAGTGLAVTNNATVGGTLGVTGPITAPSAAIPIVKSTTSTEALTSSFGTANGSPALFTSTTALGAQVNPTYSTTVTPGILFQGAYSGTITSGQAFFNQWGSGADTVDATLAGGGGATFLYMQETLSAGAKGGRTALGANFYQVGATTAVAGQYYVALGSFAYGSYSAGGSVGTLLGNLFANNFGVSLNTGAGLYWNSVTGSEIDVGVQTGVKVGYKVGLKIVQFASDAVQGTLSDYAIGMNNQSGGTAPGWSIGFAFGGPEGWWPMKSTGTLIGTYTSFIGGGPAMQAAYGIDWSAVTFSAGFLKSTGFLVDGSGNVTGASYKAGAAVGVTCAATPTALFTSTNGIVTHC